MKRKKQALDVLLAHSGQRCLKPELLLALAVLALFVSMPVMVDVITQRGLENFSGSYIFYTLQVVFGVVLPFCCAWDSRLLKGVREHRFLDDILLSCITPREWSDGLLWHGLCTVLPAAMPLYVLGLLLSPGLTVLLHMALWLPMVVCLLVTVSYVHQLSQAQGMGALLSIVLAGLAALMVWSWTTCDTMAVAQLLVLSVCSLVLCRMVVLRSLDAMRLDPGRKVTFARA